MSDVSVTIIEPSVSVSESVSDVVIVEAVTSVSTVEVGISGPIGASGVVSATAPLYNDGTASSASLRLDQSALSITPAQVSGTAVVTGDARLTNARTPTAHAGTHAAAGTDPLTISPSQVTGTAVVTGDSRLSDARTPTTHAATHGTAGSDPITIAPSQVTGTAITISDFLQSALGYPAAGYDTFSRYFVSSSSSVTNGQMYGCLFTPLKTVIVSNVTTQLTQGRLDYGYSSAYRAVCLYQCSGTNNTTWTPLAVTWDKDPYLWASSNSGPTTTPVTGISGSAFTGNGWTWIACTGNGANFTTGQKVTMTGTAGSPGFSSFTGMIVGSPSSTSFVIQCAGTSVVTGTISAATVTGRPYNPSTCVVTGGSVASGTGTVATVNVTCSAMTNEYTAGQWVNVVASGLTISGTVAESPAPTSTSFTLYCPSTLTSGSVGTGSASCPDSYGRYVRPLFQPTANGTGVVTPKSVQLNQGTTYAIGVMSYAVGGTNSAPSFAVAAPSSANQLNLPYLSLGKANLNTFTSTAISADTVSSAAPWARLT